VGPLESNAAGFAGMLTEQGYSSSAIWQHMHLAAQLSSWLAAQGLAVGEFAGRAVDEFVEVMRETRTYLVSARALAPVLEYLRGLECLPEAGAGELVRDALRRAFQEYLRSERGLSEQTIVNYTGPAVAFLEELDDPVEQALAGLTGAQVLGIVSRQVRRRPGSAQQVVTADRSLLRFLYVTGRIPLPLAEIVPKAAKRQARLPRWPAGATVTALLEGCDRRTQTGCRDYAVLVMLHRLGLRVGEVARLTLDDFRWRRGEVVICGKRGRVDVLPLTWDVGEAVVEYLRARRTAPVGVRGVFLTIQAPVRPLTRYGVAAIVRNACDRAGVPRIGPHALRRALGCELLAAGASLPEIGQVLRHDDIATTALYARVDQAALARLVRPWPGTGSPIPA
jgi:site-specific recombinase XerD